MQIVDFAKIGAGIAKFVKAFFGAFKGMSLEEILSMLGFAGAAIMGIIEFFKKLKKSIRNAKTRNHTHPVFSTLSGVDSDEKAAIRDSIIKNANEEDQINVTGAEKDYTSKKSKQYIKKINEKLDKREEWMKYRNRRFVPKTGEVELEENSGRDIYKGISMTDPRFGKIAAKFMKRNNRAVAA